jgi:ribosomal protein L37AE/L43A
MSAVATRRRGKQLALVTERPRREVFEIERLRRERSHNCSDGGRLTLEQRLDGVWEGLHAAGVADCPLCGGRMEATGEAAGRCGGCGSTLS